MICVRDDMFKAVWADRVVGALSGSVCRGVIRHGGVESPAKLVDFG